VDAVEGWVDPNRAFEMDGSRPPGRPNTATRAGRHCGRKERKAVFRFDVASSGSGMKGDHLPPSSYTYSPAYWAM
jgi:hypothetical protein